MRAKRKPCTVNQTLLLCYYHPLPDVVQLGSCTWKQGLTPRIATAASNIVQKPKTRGLVFSMRAPPNKRQIMENILREKSNIRRVQMGTESPLFRERRYARFSEYSPKTSFPNMQLCSPQQLSTRRSPQTNACKWLGLVELR